MADKKISQLSATTESNDNVWIVMNNSGNTETFRIKRVDLLSGTTTPDVFDEGDGTDSIKATYLLGTDASNTKTFAVGDGATATGVRSSVIGGINGLASGQDSICLGGTGNDATGWQSFVAGYNNLSEGEISAVFGNQNRAKGQATGVFAGTNNSIFASNQASHKENIIIGGQGNTITDSFRSGIFGGQGNSMNGKSYVVMLGTTGLTATENNTTYVDNIKVISNLILADYANLDFVDDTAAAAGGVSLGGVYHTSGALKVRVS